MMRGLLRVLLGAALLLFPCGVANAARAYHDITCETTSTVGTGTISLGGASGSYLPFSSLFTSGDTVSYGITSGDGKYETGTGTYTSGAPGTLTRTLASSTTGSLLTLVAPSIVCAELNSAWLQPGLGIADSPTFGGETLTGTLSASGQTIDLSTTGKLNTGTIELGHATDTTLSRLAASRAGIEGAPVGLYTFASSAPASPQVGDVWVDSTTSITYRYVNDGDSSQWVQIPGNSTNTSTVKVQVFTASGTYTPTAGMKTAKITCIGSGASGGGAALTSGTIAVSTGGGGGGAAVAYVTAAQVGASQSVTVGAGASAPTAGNNAGNNGNSSSVGSLCVATGGTKGNGAAAAAVSNIAGGSLGGIGTTGDVLIRGGSGTWSVGVAATPFALPGYGGNGALGGGGGIGVNSAGVAGGAPGGGGSGCYTFGGAACAGGAGADGEVIIEEHLTGP